MEDRQRSTWLMVGGMVAALVIPALIVAGVLIGTSGPDDGRAAQATTTSSARSSGTTGNLPDDRLAVLEARGDVRAMVEQHQAMMDQMRVSSTPQMLQLMNTDPMWQMMRSGENVRLLEEHEESIDRMLARGG